MAKTVWPPGVRFHPTDVELIKYYLKRKILGKKIRFNIIAEVDIYKFAPWDLPDKSSLGSKDLKWYFLCPREKKYANGARTNRATDFGYWKTTGRDRAIQYNNEVVGMIKTLVFHKGKPPQGARTDWVMHEYRLEDKDLVDKGFAQDAYVVCVIFQKEGPGPRNGAQYGAPFREEDWSDDEEVDSGGPVAAAGLSIPDFVLPNNQSIAAPTTNHLPEDIGFGTPSESCLCNTVPSYSVPLPVPTLSEPMMACFTEDGTLISDGNERNEQLNNVSRDVDAETPPSGSDVNDFFQGLGDLNNMGRLSEGGFYFSSACEPMQTLDQRLYLELHDLDAPLNHPSDVNASDCILDGCLNIDNNSHSSQHLSYQVNTCTDEHVSGLKGWFPNLSGEPHRFQDNVDMFHKGNGFHKSTDGGNSFYEATAYTGDGTPCERFVLGNQHSPQELGGGRFFNLLSH